MADQEHIEQGDSGGLTLEDLCGGPVDTDVLRHVPEPEFTASACNLHHQLELQHQLLSNMKADFDQKWDHRELALQDQMEAQRRDLERLLGEQRCRAHVVNHSSSFAGLRGGSPSGPSGLESTKSTTCPTLGSDGKGEMVTVVEYKAWAFRARAWYETNSMVVPKKNSELLASIRGKPAQVIAASVLIDMALGSDGVQKIGEVLDAYFGVDGCEGLLSAVRELIHGRRGHKPMMEYSMGVAEVVGRIQLQGVVIDQRLSGCVLVENSDLSADQKAMVLATTNRDVSFSSVQVALRNLFADSHGSGAVSLVTDTRHGAGSRSAKGKDTNRKGGYKGGGGQGGQGDSRITCFRCGKAAHVAADCWSPPRNKGGKGESFVADAQEVQVDKKDTLVTEDSSPQHRSSYVGPCYMANSGLDVGLGRLQSLLSECLLKGLLDIWCTDTVAGDEWLAHWYGSTGQQLVQEPGSMHFTFGGGDTKLADRVVFIHILIDYHWVQLRVNVIEGPTPLLIGRKTLSLLQARIDVTKCEVRFRIFGREFFMPCELSSSGHMLMQLWQPAWQPGMPELVGTY